MNDLIKREDAMKVAMWFGRSEQKYSHSFIKKRVMEIPSAERKGEWKKVKNVHAWDVSGIETWGVKRKCTNCDFRHTFIEDHGHYNFCPHCGAKMKGADDE